MSKAHLVAGTNCPLQPPKAIKNKVFADLKSFKLYLKLDF